MRISILSLFFGATLPITAFAAQPSEPPAVGDRVHGARVFAEACAGCHGAKADGGPVGVSLRDSGRMNAIRDDAYFTLIDSGKGTKKPQDHAFRGKLSFLDTWDVVAYGRSQHLQLADFFGTSSRYLADKYTIDANGSERIEAATGKPIPDKSAYVFTFFNVPNDDGHLKYVPADPIELDKLKKKLKAGYLVFVPIETKTFAGELGIAMDNNGVIQRLAVLDSSKDASLVNKTLAKFEGQGKKGLKTAFKVGGGDTVQKLADEVFRAYMRAMETVTMYDRAENERTWADD